MEEGTEKEEITEKVYERKLSVAKRFYKLLTAPAEAMEDISLAPDFGGVAIVIFLEMILSVIAIVLAFQKIQLTGPYADSVMRFVTVIVTLAIVIALGLFLVRWLVKSLLVKGLCDSGSSWSFSAAASVTGYAYFADVIFGLLGLIVWWILVPGLVIDTTDLTQAELAVAQYQAQIGWLTLAFTLPMGMIRILWKSYLGGLGAHFGTKKLCSLGAGLAVFFILGLIGFALDLVA